MGTCLGGIVKEGVGDRAVLTVGLRVDQPRSGSLKVKPGRSIGYARAKRRLAKLRQQQVGREAADATLVRCGGLWGGRTETTLSCEIEFVPSAHETRRATFRKHMMDLAEQAAELFGQKEVWLRMGGRLYRANAPGERAPKVLLRGGKVVR